MALFNFGKKKDEILEKKIIELEDRINQKKVELSEIQKMFKISTDISKAELQLQEKREKLSALRKEIISITDEISLQETGFFEKQYKFSDSTVYKERLDILRNKQKDMIKNGTAGSITHAMTLNGSKSKGITMQKQLIKAALRGFNGEADALLVKITVSNVQNKIVTLEKAFNQLNKLYSHNNIQINQSYLDLKIDELSLAAEYEYKKQEEKELLREQREQEREDKKLQAEIASRRKQLDKDRKHFTKMLKNVEELIQKSESDEEIERLKLQIQEYQNALSDINDIEEDIDYREGHATAGYVYIISNIGAFGEDVYKIGVTRRLEPLDRIRELGSASVPFQFDVHALIFSEQAFSLEAELHKKFEKYKVNKVNGRKEYFKVPFEQIKKALAQHKELTIELTEHAEAFEYRQSIK